MSVSVLRLSCEYPCTAPGVYLLTDGAGADWLCCGRHLGVMVRLHGPGTVEVMIP